MKYIFLPILLLACGLLLAGGGLLSVPAAAFCTVLLNRFFSRRRVLGVLGRPPEAVASPG